MSYNALDVAKFIVSDGYENCKPVTNLRLQKLLYLVWIAYFKKKNDYLFRDTFHAWKFGPVVLNVYREFCKYLGEPIYKKFKTNIQEEDASIIREIVKSFDGKSTAALVGITHAYGSPWHTVFGGGSGYNKEIPFEQIINAECKQQ